MDKPFEVRKNNENGKYGIWDTRQEQWWGMGLPYFSEDESETNDTCSKINLLWQQKLEMDR